MPKFNVEIIEAVFVTISAEIEADTKGKAAAIALNQWLGEGKGKKTEDVSERWVEVDGEIVYVDEDEGDDDA